MNQVHNVVFKCLVILSWGLLSAGCGSVENAYVPPPPPEVTTAKPVKQMITPFLEENGVIEAVDQAEVRARVRGFVEAVKFEPGQDVSQGDVLYQIEADPYRVAVQSAQAAVDAAEAAIAVAESQVKVAEAKYKETQKNLAREESLMKQNAGSQAMLDAAIAANDAASASQESAIATVQAAIADKGRSIAALAQSQLDLDYTIVRSPIDGRITATDVKVGNLVDDGGKLANVVNRNEVFANFSISDRTMLDFMKAQRADMKPGEQYTEPDWSEIPVYLQRETDEGFPFVGILNYVNQEGIDAQTGTLGMRSLHPNPDNNLFPGLFVNIRIPIGEQIEALLIPEYAVLRDQRGQFVLVVNDEEKVERVTISTSKTITGWTVVDSGLATDASVIIDGLQRARPGLEVKAVEESLAIDDQTLLRGFSIPKDADDSSESIKPEIETAPSETE